MKLNTRSREFNLCRYFTLFSISIIVPLTIILSYFVFWNQKHIFIDYSIESIENFAHQFNYRIYDYFEFGFDKTSGLAIEKGSPQYRKLDMFVTSYIEGSGEIIWMRIFNRTGKVIYSSRHKKAEAVSRDYLDIVLRGETYSRFTPVNKGIVGAEIEKTELIEVFMPLYSNVNSADPGNIIGILEIHQKAPPLYYLMKGHFYKIPLMLVFAMGTLFFSLQVVIRKADGIIRKKTEQVDNYNKELEEAQQVIKTSIEEVIEHESFRVRYESSCLAKCWELKNCDKVDCPAYRTDDLRCWQTAGTFCSGEVEGVFATKYGDCKKCDVYKQAFTDRINTIGESFNNMMTLLENKHSEIHDLYEKMNVLIDIDALTQIGNRRSFQKRIGNMHLISLRYDHPYSVIMFDVDDFKLYNDTYGHQKGDYVLISIANAMKSFLRKSDEVFRWGGEEFVVILPEQSVSDAIIVAEHLRDAVQKLAIEHSESAAKVVTISCGVSSNHGNVLTWESVLKNADDALYRSKVFGKNTVCLYSDSDKTA